MVAMLWLDSSSGPSTEPDSWGATGISALLPRTRLSLWAKAPSEQDWGVEEGSIALVVVGSWKERRHLTTNSINKQLVWWQQNNYYPKTQQTNCSLNKTNFSNSLQQCHYGWMACQTDFKTAIVWVENIFDLPTQQQLEGQQWRECYHIDILESSTFGGCQTLHFYGIKKHSGNLKKKQKTFLQVPTEKPHLQGFGFNTLQGCSSANGSRPFGTMFWHRASFSGDFFSAKVADVPKSDDVAKNVFPSWRVTAPVKIRSALTWALVRMVSNMEANVVIPNHIPITCCLTTRGENRLVTGD